MKVLNTLRFAIDLSGPDRTSVPGSADLGLRRRAAPHRQLDHLLRHCGRAAVRADGRLHAQHRQRHRQLPRQAALHPDPLAAQHRDACDDVRSQSRGRAAGDPAGRGASSSSLLEGTQGIGVILAPEVNVAEAIIETLHSTKQNVLIQSFVKESRGRDCELVVGDRVVAAMRRVAHGDEFRSNVHRGGSVEAVSLPSEYEEAAVRSAQIMGLRVAGVDMLESVDGPLVMEVNSSPASSIETATKLDVAGAIIDYVSHQVGFPEIDVRQRLTVSTGTAWPSSPCTGVPISSARRSRSQVSTTATSPSSPSTAAPPSSRTRVDAPSAGRGPAALLRQARGDAVDDSRATA